VTIVVAIVIVVIAWRHRRHRRRVFVMPRIDIAAAAAQRGGVPLFETVAVRKETSRSTPPMSTREQKSLCMRTFQEHAHSFFLLITIFCFLYFNVCFVSVSTGSQDSLHSSGYEQNTQMIFTHVTKIKLKLIAKDCVDQ
jgi:hypothetical protein